MGSKELVGINEDKIDKLVLDIYDYIERINGTLNSIENEINNTASCFDCDSGRELRSKFNNQKPMFSVINDNLMKDTDTLIKVKSSTVDFSRELANQIVNKSVTKVTDEIMNIKK